MTEDEIAALSGGRKAAKRVTVKQPSKLERDYARMYYALRSIKAYASPDYLRRHAEQEYGCSPRDAIEMAYENVIGEAQLGLKGVRKP
jgi:hypothetical protein